MTAKALLIVAAVVVFALGVFGVHIASVSGERWTDGGLCLLAASFIVP